MVTIDLTTPPPPAASFLDGLPRRLALTLPELRHVADLAGGAPLPFDLVEAAGPDGLEGRLGQSRGSLEDDAVRAHHHHAPPNQSHPCVAHPATRSS